jgi:hypothetical protein
MWRENSMGAEFFVWMTIPAIFLSLWLMKCLRIGFLDFMVDPRGILSLMVVIWAALLVLTTLIIDLIKGFIHFLTSLPVSLVMIIPILAAAIFFGWKIFSCRRFSSIDF